MSAAPEFHTETGRVVEVHRGRAIIELDPGAGAGRKPECARCGLCAALPGAAGGGVELRAEAPRELAIAPGDRVEIRLRLASPGKAAALLLGLPLVAFLAAAGVAYALSKSEGVVLAAAFAALAAGFLILHLVDRRRGARATITRKLEGQ